MIAEPIFIIGTERSGSNLLRLILNAHSAIVVPHPPHIMRYFGPLEASYGDLHDPRAFRQLAQDVVRLVQLHIYPWERKLDVDALVTTASPRDLLGLTLGVYEQARAWSGKRRWGCKSTFMLDCVDRVLASLPGARFIYLVRDPRDVAVSSLTSVFNPYHPFFTATLWRRQQLAALALEERLPRTTLHRLRYEDLLSEPEAEVRRLCDFLEEPFEPAMLQFFSTADARKSASLSASWRNTDRPIDRSRAGRHVKELDDASTALVEALADGPMQRLGYSLRRTPAELEAAAAGRPTLADHLVDVGLRLRAEASSLLHDRNHWRRWARAVYLLELDWRRRFARA